MFKVGQIVMSKAGKEKDKFLVVIGYEGKFLKLVDGKLRPLSKPKLKNEIHVQKTNMYLTDEQLVTDKKIRTALQDLNAKG